MKVSTEIDINFGYEKITQLVDNIPLKYYSLLIWIAKYALPIVSFWITWPVIILDSITCDGVIIDHVINMT